jgi:glutathione S-transferase
MVLKLYATNISPPSRFAALVLLEKKVPFELINVDLAKQEQKLPEHTARQPFGQIPYIDDDGFILYESWAIARYIAAKYPNQGTKLIPTDDPKAYALFDQATFTHLAHFNDPAFGLFFQLIVTKFIGKTADEEKVKELKATLNASFDVYEKILGKQQYLAGKQISLADIAHIPLIGALFDAGVNFGEGRPAVARWVSELLDRPSWRSLQTKGMATTTSY